jgi:hypothetical protein
MKGLDMKKLLMFFLCALAINALPVQNISAQVMLQKAVVSNGAGVATNGTTNGIFVVGQTAAGTATNGQIVGQFGFLTTPPAAINAVNNSAGPITSLSVTPNPASNDVVISVSLANTENIDLFLYDATGNLISTIFSGKKGSGSFTARLDARTLSSGTYFIAARVPGALLQTKLNVVK